MSKQPKLEGWTDDVGDVLKKALPIVEAVLPAIAPQAAPIVAAERALRAGIGLDFGEAKKATTAATNIGKAVAASQGVETNSTSSTSSTLKMTAEPSTSSTTSKLSVAEPKTATSNSMLWLVGAVGLLFFFHSR